MVPYWSNLLTVTKMLKGRFTTIIVLGIATFLSLGLGNLEKAFAFDDSKFDKCGFDSKCIVKLLQNRAQSEEPNSVMSNYLVYIEESSTLKASCHTVTHLFGQWVYEKYGVKKFDEEITGCLSGYMHGFLIGISKNSINGSAYLGKAKALCATIPSVNKKGLCVHGLGHGATFIVKSLAEANRMCLTFKESALQLECIDGTAMEWNNSKLGSKSLTTQYLLKLCQDLTTQANLHRECLAQILQHQSGTGNDPEKLKTFCNQQSASAFDGCYEALGYLLVNQSFSKAVNDPTILSSLIRVYCNEKIHAWCVTSIVSRGLSLTMDKNSAMVICNGISKGLAKVCSQAVNNTKRNIAEG